MGTFYGPAGLQFVSDTAQRFDLGATLQLPDGRRFRYALIGGTSTVAANLYQAVAPASNHRNRTTTAAAIGATAVGLNIGATAAAIDIYAEGTVHINDATGEGYLYKIKRARNAGDAHAAAAGSDVLTVNLEGPAGDTSGPVATKYGENVQVALVSGVSEASVMRNRFHSVIIHPSPPTAQIAGVAPKVITNATYGWLATKGEAAVLTDGTIVAARSVMASDSVDGAVEALGFTEAAPNTEIAAVVGRVVDVNADTEESPINLQID